MPRILPGLILALSLCAGCRRPAQLGDDVKCHKAAEALYTAVCSRKTELLDASEKRINDLSAQGEMPTKAHKELTAIIARARAGRWQPAAEELHGFISGQEPAGRKH